MPRRAHASAVLALKVKPLRGRFANLDHSARRWLFGLHVSLVFESGLLAASRTKETWRQNAAPTRRGHPAGAEAERRSGEAA